MQKMLPMQNAQKHKIQTTFVLKDYRNNSQKYRLLIFIRNIYTHTFYAKECNEVNIRKQKYATVY